MAKQQDEELTFNKMSVQEQTEFLRNLTLAVKTDEFAFQQATSILNLLQERSTAGARLLHFINSNKVPANANV